VKGGDRRAGSKRARASAAARPSPRRRSTSRFLTRRRADVRYRKSVIQLTFWV